MVVWSIDLWRIDGLLCSKEIVFKFSFFFLVIHKCQFSVQLCGCLSISLIVCVLLNSLRRCGCLYLHSLLWSDLWKSSHDQCCFPPSALRQLHQIYWASCYVTESCCNHFLMKDIQIDRWLYILSTSAVVMMILWGGKQLSVPISYKLCEFLLYWHISVLSYV